MNVERDQLLLEPRAEYISAAFECPKRMRDICKRQKRPATIAPKRESRWLFEQARPPVRARLLRVSQPRRYREGQKPVSIGSRPLSNRERAADADLRLELLFHGVYNTRPRVWRDCRPLRCPFCEEKVVMTVVEGEGDDQDRFSCPKCQKLVRFSEDTGGNPQWVRSSKSAKPIPLTPENYPAYARALNHAGACPYLTCRHNLFADIDTESGIIKLNFPVLSEDGRLIDFADLSKESCSMRAVDLAIDDDDDGDDDDDDEMTLDQIGRNVNLTQERVNQVIRSGVRKLAESDVCDELIAGVTRPRRRQGRNQRKHGI